MEIRAFYWTAGWGFRWQHEALRALMRGNAISDHSLWLHLEHSHCTSDPSFCIVVKCCVNDYTVYNGPYDCSTEGLFSSRTSVQVGCRIVWRIAWIFVNDTISGAAGPVWSLGCREDATNTAGSTAEFKLGDTLSATAEAEASPSCPWHAWLALKGFKVNCTNKQKFYNYSIRGWEFFFKEILGGLFNG